MFRKRQAKPDAYIDVEACQRAVEIAAHLYMDHPELDLSELLEHSEFQDFDESIALRACAFTPAAFAHIVLTSRGMTMQDYFLAETVDGTRIRSKYQDESCYVAAMEYAPTFEDQHGGRMLLRVACASAEMKVVLKLAGEGCNIAEIRLTEATVFL
jgi:hypothetical protein